jgi:hypothetical protein
MIMQMQFIILLGLVLVSVWAMTRARNRVKPIWAQQLKGWQKIFGVIAIVAMVLIVLNPEFLALGLLGDTAFFDLFVLALSLQMHTFVVRGCRACLDVVARVRWKWIPSPGWLYILTIWTFVIGNLAPVIRKASRLFSSHVMA